MNDAVGIENAHEIDVFKIETLDDHLCSYKNIDLLLLKLLNKRVMSRPPSHAVDIHAGNTGVGEDSFEMFFYPLGAKITLDEAMVAAGGAGVDGRIYGAAIVAM